MDQNEVRKFSNVTAHLNKYLVEAKLPKIWVYQPEDTDQI
jgi:hypothetical protein